ncbi:hypothetical protein ACIGXM_02830 [Kitasatospora sp. NPDC052896]|uniref:hypothetical protein n=1 Tax=Kitasatospora sp. NPDC052896 TaxID=3364061 RepID=UPI0037C671C3
MIHDEVARRVVRELPARLLAPRRLGSGSRVRLAEESPRALVRDLDPRPLTRRAERGRFDTPASW